MTRSEACEILGISGNASALMARAAYKMQRSEAASANEKKVLATALNIALGSIPGEQEETSQETQRPEANSQAVPSFDIPDPLPASAFDGLPVTRPSRTYTGKKHVSKLLGMISLSYGHGKIINCVSISPNSQTFLSGGFDGEKGNPGCFQWNIHGGDSYRYQHGASTICCDISKDGQYAVSGGLDGLIVVWDYNSHKVLRSKKIFKYENVFTVEFIGETTNILVGGSEGATQNWEPFGDTQEDRRIEGIERVHDIWLSPEGHNAIIVSDSEFIHVIDLQNNKIKQFTGNFVEERSPEPRYQRVTATNDAKTIVCTDGDTLLRCYIVGDRVHRVHEPFKIGTARALAISPDQQHMITGFRDQLLLWNLPENRPMSTLSGHEGKITDVTFAPDNSFALSTGEDSSIRLWRF